jgi:hypothetical protein
MPRKRKPEFKFWPEQLAVWNASPNLTLCPKYRNRRIGFDKVIAHIKRDVIRLPAFSCCDPMVCCPRGIMSDMLLMAAFQFGNPIISVTSFRVWLALMVLQFMGHTFCAGL